jgi:hypothetical protein
MRNFLDIHTKTDLLKQPISSLHNISKGCSADYGPRRTVGDPKHQMTTTLVCNGYAIS